MAPDRRLALRNAAFAVAAGGRPAAGDLARLIAVLHQEIDRVDIGPQGTATRAALDHALATDTLVCFVDGMAPPAANAWRRAPNAI